MKFLRTLSASWQTPKSVYSYVQYLKGQFQEIFDPVFFGQNILHRPVWPDYIDFAKNFWFHRDIREICVVNNNANTGFVLVYSLVIRHDVRVVIDHAESASRVFFILILKDKRSNVVQELHAHFAIDFWWRQHSR